MADILHVDMDAFYASVEALDDPSLAGLPLIVGGIGARGVVASCSYEARRFGVRSAMPTARARQLCPHARFVAGRFDRYSEISRQIHAIFHDVTPLVEGISLDEAFLDVTGSTRLFGPAPQIAAAIRCRIGEEIGLGCSVGVAPVKFLAKLASEAAKPVATRSGISPGPGVTVIREGEELAFLHPLPIEALWGVGPATAARLRGLGITTVAELARVTTDTLVRTVGHAAGVHLARLARAEDDRPVEPDREVKSVSHEETYPVDRRDADGLLIEIVRMSDAVAGRLRRAALSGRTVTLKVRYGDFETRTRSRTNPVPLAEGPAIARLASQLFDGLDLTAGVRLLGVGVSNLGGVADVEQMSLDLEGEFGVPSGHSVSASEAVHAIRERFGARSVGPAALLGPGGLRLKRQGDTQWGPADR